LARLPPTTTLPPCSTADATAWSNAFALASSISGPTSVFLSNGLPILHCP
jgi:hypothetical protein